MSTDQILSSPAMKVIALALFLLAVAAALGSCSYCKHTANAYRGINDTTQVRHYVTGNLNYQY